MKKFINNKNNISISFLHGTLGIFFIFIFLLSPVFGQVHIAEADDGLWPAEPVNLQTSGKLVADLSTAHEGYFQAALTGPSKNKMKMRVQKGDVTLTYDMDLKGNYDIFPLQLGSGHYDISLYENVSGKKYSQAGYLSVNVTLDREDAAFYYPNQYVDYNILSEAVAKAAELCNGITDPVKIYETLRDYMVNSFMYDYIKAVTVQPGELPDIDGSYDKKMGVCQDLSAIFACMMRTQGLPTRLIIGYADKQYHAWTTTEINGKEYFFDPTAALNAIATIKNYSVERYY